jgi:hypothetical protein
MIIFFGFWIAPRRGEVLEGILPTPFGRLASILSQPYVFSRAVWHPLEYQTSSIQQKVLTVGIGGGVPSTKNDVVVSKF